MTEEETIDLPIDIGIVEEMITICAGMSLDRDLSDRQRAMALTVATELLQRKNNVTKRDLYSMTGMHHVETILGAFNARPYCQNTIENSRNRLYLFAMRRVCSKLRAACISILES